MMLIVLIVVGIVLVLALVLGIAYAVSRSHESAPDTTPEPLPGGGGSYTMHISGMNCEHCRANAEAALNAFAGVTAQVDLKTETAHIRYDGYPDLTLLDRLREAVEQAGFTVTEIR